MEIMKKLVLTATLSLFVASMYAGEGEGCSKHKEKSCDKDKAKAECPAKKAEAEKKATTDGKPAESEKK